MTIDLSGLSQKRKNKKSRNLDNQFVQRVVNLSELPQPNNQIQDNPRYMNASQYDQKTLAKYSPFNTKDATRLSHINN